MLDDCLSGTTDYHALNAMLNLYDADGMAALALARGDENLAMSFMEERLLQNSFPMLVQHLHCMTRIVSGGALASF